MSNSLRKALDRIEKQKDAKIKYLEDKLEFLMNIEHPDPLTRHKKDPMDAVRDQIEEEVRSMEDMLNNKQ